MTFRLLDCILTWVFTPRRLFGLVDLSYFFSMIHSPIHVFLLSQRDGHCVFNARYSLRGNRITKNKSDAAVHHIMEFVYCFDALPVSIGNLPYSAFRSHRKGQANPLDFRIPIALDVHENLHEKLFPSTHQTRRFSHSVSARERHAP